MSQLTAKLTTIEQKALNEFKDKLAKKFGSDLVMVKLFGSKARGDFHKESDLDILIVLKDIREQDKNFISAIEYKLMIKFDVFVSSIIFSEEKWQEYINENFSLAYNIEDEGINLWQNLKPIRKK